MPAMPQIDSSLPILNPNIYLNYLSPELAKQFELARNVSLVTLGALLCDILISLPEDLALIKSGMGPTIIGYSLARVAGLAYVVLSVILKTNPGLHCSAQELGVGLCWILSTAAFSFLFLQRALAVFHHRRLCRYFFSCLFLANVGVALVVPIGNQAGPLGQTGYCINTRIAPYTSAAVFSRLLFDSCVFLGISYELAITHRSPGVPLTWHAFVTGKSSPCLLVGVLLRGGQQYYLLSVCSNIIMSFLIVSRNIPLAYEVMFTVPDIALTTSMACRVFRNLRTTAANHADVSMTSAMEFSSASGHDSIGSDALTRSYAPSVEK